MALTRLYCHDTYFDATDGFTYTPGMRLTLDPATQSARITRLTNSGVFSTDETLDPSAPGPIGDDTPSTGAFTTLTASGNVNFDTGTLFVSASTNFVGFGVTSPETLIDVINPNIGVANISASASDYHFLLRSTGNTTGNYEGGIGFSDPGSDVVTSAITVFDDGGGGAQGIAIATGDASSISGRIWVTSTGDVGIDINDPDYLAHVNGALGIAPGSSVTPVNNGDVVFEATDNTTFTVKLKGSDGTVRSGTVTLS